MSIQHAQQVDKAFSELNFERCKLFSIVLSILGLTMAVADYFVNDLSNPLILVVHFAHWFIFLVSFVVMIYTLVWKKKENGTIIGIAYATAIILEGALLSPIVDVPLDRGILVYLFSMLAVSAILYFRYYISILMVGISFIIFIFFLIHNQTDSNKLTGEIFNASAFALISVFLFTSSYRRKATELDQNLIISSQRDKILVKSNELEKTNDELLNRNNEIRTQRDQIIQQKTQLEKSLKENEKLREGLQHELNKTTQVMLCKQMNPHFIFNSLNSIQGYIVLNDQDSSMDYLANFAELMRLTLHNSSLDDVPIASEMEALNLYMELENLRLSGRLTYSIEVDKEIDANEYRIPSMVLQPFIENSIWHGIAPKQETGHILIQFNLLEDRIRVSIKDDGIGRKKAQQVNSKEKSEHKSVGIGITQARLDLVALLYNCDSEIRYIDMEDDHGNATGTEVVFMLPVILS